MKGATGGKKLPEKQVRGLIYAKSALSRQLFEMQARIAGLFSVALILQQLMAWATPAVLRYAFRIVADLAAKRFWRLATSYSTVPTPRQYCFTP